MAATRNKTRYLILGLLSERPMSGYDIKKLVDLRFSYFWSESYGQIYPELKRLEEEGLVEKVVASSGEVQPSSGRAKKGFAITESGRHGLRSWLAEPVEKEVMRFEILLKLYYANMVSPKVMLARIREFRVSHLRQQELFTLFERQVRSAGESDGNHPFVLLVLLFGQKVWRAYDEWCDEAISVLESLPAGRDDVASVEPSKR